MQVKARVNLIVTNGNYSEIKKTHFLSAGWVIKVQAGGFTCIAAEDEGAQILTVFTDRMEAKLNILDWIAVEGANKPGIHC